MEYTVDGVVKVRITGRQYLVEEPRLSAEAAEAVQAIVEWLTLRGLEPAPDNIAAAADHLGYGEVYARESVAIEYHVKRLMSGWGPLYPLILDEELEEVAVPRPGTVYVVHRVVNPGEYMETNIVVGEEELEDIIRRLAVKAGVGINPAYPTAEFAVDGTRVSATLRLVASTGPELTVRKFPRRPLSLDDLVERRLLPKEAAAYLSCILKSFGMVFIIGRTGSGKTTLLGALLDTLPDPEWRVVTIEETPELRLRRRNWTSLHTREPRSLAEPERIRVPVDRLLREALRKRPHCIAVTEARGPEVRYIFEAAALGEASAATFHARSLEELVHRLRLLDVDEPLLDLLHAVVLLGIVDLPDGTRGRRMLALWERHNGDFRLLWRWVPENDTWEAAERSTRC